jgi:hypothetical protein
MSQRTESPTSRQKPAHSHNPRPTNDTPDKKSRIQLCIALVELAALFVMYVTALAALGVVRAASNLIARLSS